MCPILTLIQQLQTIGTNTNSRYWHDGSQLNTHQYKSRQQMLLLKQIICVHVRNSPYMYVIRRTREMMHLA